MLEHKTPKFLFPIMLGLLTLGLGTADTKPSCASPAKLPSNRFFAPFSGTDTRFAAERAAYVPQQNTREQAGTVLQQMADTYRSLKSYSSAISLEVTGLEKPAQLRADVAIERPGRCAIALHEGDPDSIRELAYAKQAITPPAAGSAPVRLTPRRIVAEKGQVTATFGKSGDRYRRQPLAPKSPVAYIALEQSRLLLATTLAQFLIGDNPASRSLPTATEVTLAEPTTVGTTPVDVVIIVVDQRGSNAPPRRAGLAPAFRKEEITKYYIGQQDHLLRACTRTVVDGTRVITYTETLTNIRVNQPLDAELFRLTLPPGAIDILKPK